MATTPDDAILKEVGEARKALDALNRGLGTLVSRLPKVVLAEKAKPAALKVHAFLDRYAPVTKVVGSKVYDSLKPETQKALLWLDGTIAELMKTESALRKARKTQELDFAKDPEAVLKAIRIASKEMGTPPSWVPKILVRIEKDIEINDDKKKRTEALVKIMQKGEEIGGIPGTAITSLSFMVLLYFIWKYLTDRLK